MKVKELIADQKVVTAQIDQELEPIVRLMEAHQITGVPIVDEWGALAGLVTASALLRVAAPHPEHLKGLPSDPTWSPAQRAVVHGSGWEHLAVKDVMTTDLCTVDGDDDVRDAARSLVNRRVHHAIVLGPDRNVHGVVSSLDFTLLVAEHGLNEG